MSWPERTLTAEEVRVIADALAKDTGTTVTHTFRNSARRRSVLCNRVQLTVAQEAGALLRPFIEYTELLTYFKKFPETVELAIEGKLTSAGERAKAINGSCCNEGPRYGYVQFARPPLILAAMKEGRHSCSWPLLVRDTERCAMVLLAGAVAESKLFARALRSHGCESDLQKCLALCELLHYDGSRRAKARCTSVEGIGSAAIANLLRRRTAQLLNRADMWRAVVALAEDLKTWSQLTGPDAEDTAQWTRRVRNQLRLLFPLPEHGSRVHEEGDSRVSPVTGRARCR